MRTTMFLYLPSWFLECNASHTMRHCKCKPVQASFSSCFGQLFSKIFNFSCVLLPLLIWLLNAWVCACLNVCGNREEKRIRKEPSKSICIYIYTVYLAHLQQCVQLCFSICHPDSWNAMRPTPWDIASASQCKQASAAALDNCFRRSSTSAAFCCRSWSDSSMLESMHVWKCAGIARKNG